MSERPVYNPALPLLIPRGLHAAILDHCRREAPRECCGILGGEGARVRSLFRLRNSAPGNDRYEADPRDLIWAFEELRTSQQTLLAIYHSHPNWPATPSRTDLARNFYGDLPQIIVSLLNEPPTLRVWSLKESTCEPLPWSTVDDDEQPIVRDRLDG